MTIRDFRESLQEIPFENYEHDFYDYSSCYDWKQCFLFGVRIVTKKRGPIVSDTQKASYLNFEYKIGCTNQIIEIIF